MLKNAAELGLFTVREFVEGEKMLGVREEEDKFLEKKNKNI